MAQDSVFWDGIVTGHAASTDVWSAPYSSNEYSDVYSKLLGSNAARAYIVPGYGNNLAVSANSPAAMNVLAATGALFIRGRVYENTAQQTLTIGTADATNPRMDRIVARITFASQTIELAVLAGTPGATPALPTLTQNTTTYEISLAYVWVAAATATIAATEVHDERVFAINFEQMLSAGLQTNLVINSEYMAFSSLIDPITVLRPPDMWYLVGTPSVLASTTKPSQMSRGRAVSITADAANEGMSQTIRAKASTVYAIRTLINVTAGDVGIISITDNGASPATITRNIRRTGAWIEEFILYTTPSDATTITISLMCASNTDVVQFGQVLFLEGYYTGPWRQIHETIFFTYTNVYDATYTCLTTAADNTVTLDLDTSFGSGIIPPGTLAIYIQLRALDSASSGSTGAPYVQVFPADVFGTSPGVIVMLANLPNSAQVANAGFIALNPNNQFTVNWNRVGTMDICIEIGGIVV